MPGSLSNKISRATDSDTGRPVIATLASGGKAIGAASITISDATNWTVNSKIYFSIYTLTTSGYKDSSTQTDFVGTLSGTTISNLTLTGGNDRAYLPGANTLVEQTITAKQIKDLYDLVTAQHSADSGSHTAITSTSITNNGNYNQSSGSFTVPDGSIQPNALSSGAITLGYAQITSNFVTANQTQTQVTGLSVTVNVPSGGRKVKITVFTQDVFLNANGIALVSIWDGVVGTGTQLSRTLMNNGGSAGVSAPATCMAVVTPSAGSKTYNVGFHVTANTGTFEAGTTYPAFILVEAI